MLLFILFDMFGLKGIFCSYSDGERFKILVNEIKSAQPVAAIAEIHFDQDQLREICQEQVKNFEHRACGDCKWIKKEDVILQSHEVTIYFCNNHRMYVKSEKCYCSEFEERDND